MKLVDVPGTSQRAGRYYLHMVIPAELRTSDKERLLRRGLNTTDKAEAARAVMAQRVEFDTRLRAVRLEADRERLKAALHAERDRLTAALPPADRALLAEVGGVSGLLAELQGLRAQVAFIMAGAPRANPDHDDDEVHQDARRARLVDDMDRAVSAAAIGVLGAEARRVRRLAEVLSVETSAPPSWSPEGGEGLEDLASTFADAKGWTGKLRQSLSYTVRRFKELNGDLPLARLTRAHLHDFEIASRRLPPATFAGTGKMGIREAIALGECKKIVPVSIKVRIRLIDHLKALSSFALDRGYLATDPWTGFKLNRPRVKVSVEREQARRAFTPNEVVATLALADKADPRTLDYWLPILAAFSGCRVEELCQLRVSDVVEREGFTCIKITDEGAGQKVKNRHSFRVLPVPRAVLDRGFLKYVEQRRAVGAAVLWQEMHHDRRGQATLRDVVPTGGGEGRFAAAYGHRFMRQVRQPLGLGAGADFHSYRHAWTDAARKSGIDSEVRRLITGRLDKSDPTEARYGGGDLIAEKAAALEMVAPFVVAGG